jgi:hypothetical protein
MSTDQIDRVLQEEKKRPAYSRSKPGRGRRERCDCPVCRAERGEIPDEVADFVEEFGPDVLEQALAEILGGGPKPRRGRRRSYFPF